MKKHDCRKATVILLEADGKEGHCSIRMAVQSQGRGLKESTERRKRKVSDPSHSEYRYTACCSAPGPGQRPFESPPNLHRKIKLYRDKLHFFNPNILLPLAVLVSIRSEQSHLQFHLCPSTYGIPSDCLRRSMIPSHFVQLLH